MSEKFYNTFEEFNDECLGYDNDDIINKETCKDSWIACQKMNSSKIESLKSKFFEATKTYTDEIDELQKENAALEEQIEKMKCRENCGNDFEINNNTSCPLYDFQNVRCPCDKWELMK